MAKLYGVLTLTFLLALAGTAWAVDGVVDINQARALAGGVSPGDTAGFPVTISQAGSFRLTGNLTVPDADTTGISISADNVTVDLNGFGIFGPVVCTGTPVTSCAPAASGISGSGVTSAGESVAVFNGTVQGMGRSGVNLGPRSRIENVRAVSNGNGGIFTGENCTVSSNVASGNGGNRGIVTFSSVVTNNVSEGNDPGGIECLGNGCTVTGNTAKANDGCGFEMGSSGSVIGNTATENTSFGMCFNDFGGSPSGYVNNVINDNNGGNANPQVSGGIEMGTNICGGDAVCP